jgi:predicted hydrolase (HD superfamily)
MEMLHSHVTREGLIHHCHAGGAGNEIRVRDHGPLQNKPATRFNLAQTTARCISKDQVSACNLLGVSLAQKIQKISKVRYSRNRPEHREAQTRS